MMRKTLRAAATDACTFFTSPGCPAHTNMAAYCGSRKRRHKGRGRGGLAEAGVCGALLRKARGMAGRRLGGKRLLVAATGVQQHAHLHSRQQLVAAIRLVQELSQQLQRGGAGTGKGSASRAPGSKGAECR